MTVENYLEAKDVHTRNDSFCRGLLALSEEFGFSESFKSSEELFSALKNKFEELMAKEIGSV